MTQTGGSLPGSTDGEASETEGLRERLRLAGTNVERERGSRVRVRVDLALGGREIRGELAGVGTETVELRLAAEATLDAIHEAVGRPRFRLLGIKRLHAFDADVILVVLQESEGDEIRRMIGAVPVRSTLVHGAAAAILDATNRILTRPPEPEP
jgi:hypothetical protein